MKEEKKNNMITFGEKLKLARKQAGMSQEELAEKLMVSRSAIAKWEADKGYPDISNLKAISELLSVSLDDLLSDSEKIVANTIKEPIDLSVYPKPKGNSVVEDLLMLDKYGDADRITNLSHEKVKSTGEIVLDILSWGAVSLHDWMEDRSVYYLVEKNDSEYLVCVSNEFMTSSRLSKPMGKELSIGNIRLRKTLHRVK